jgi:50S ribosomal subunit-associated GTPase HflX
LADPEHQPASAVAISAQTGAGFETLLKKIDEMLALDPLSPCRFRFPIADGASLHLLHERAQVTSTSYTGDFCEVEALTPESVKRKLAPYLVA